MGDRRDRFSDEPPAAERPPAPEPTVAEMVDVAVRRVITSIFIAGGMIALAIWSQDVEAPRYQVAAADGRVFRIDTGSGRVIACDEQENCTIIVQRGKELLDSLPPRQAPEAAPAPATGTTPGTPPGTGAGTNGAPAQLPGPATGAPGAAGASGAPLALPPPAVDPSTAPAKAKAPVER